MAVPIHHLASCPSVSPIDASALDASISALKSCISALERSINTLDGSSPKFEKIAWVCSFLVLLGVTAEIFGLWLQYRDERRLWRTGIVRAPEKPSLGKFWFEAIAVLLVIVGVFGEAGSSLFLASINNQLRSKTSEFRAKSDQLLALVTQVAGIANKEAADANERAGKNEKEAAQLRRDAADLEDSISWRRIPPSKRPSMAARLTPYKGEVAWITYNMNDIEANDFGEDIADVLKQAHWKPTEQEPIERMFGGPVNPGTNKFPRGVVIRSNPGSTHEKAARALVGMLVNAGFDATEGPIVPTGITPTQIPGADVMRASTGNFGNMPLVYISVEPRPYGPQGDAELRAAKSKQKKSIPNAKR